MEIYCTTLLKSTSYQLLVSITTLVYVPLITTSFKHFVFLFSVIGKIPLPIAFWTDKTLSSLSWVPSFFGYLRDYGMITGHLEMSGSFTGVLDRKQNGVVDWTVLLLIERDGILPSWVLSVGSPILSFWSWFLSDPSLYQPVFHLTTSKVSSFTR